MATDPAGQQSRNEHFQSLRATGVLGRWQALVLAKLNELQEMPPTRNELAEALDTGVNSICGRVKELLKAGLAEHHERRACAVTGNHNTTLRITQRGMRALTELNALEQSGGLPAKRVPRPRTLAQKPSP